MKANIEIRQFIEIEIPDNKIAEIIRGFKEIVQSTGDECDMVEHIAYNVVVNRQSHVEGIGDVSINNLGSSEIEVKYDLDEIEIESEITKSQGADHE